MGTSTVRLSHDMKQQDLKAHYGSAGWLMNMIEARVVDVQTGRSLPPNQIGELWMRGPSLMQGTSSCCSCCCCCHWISEDARVCPHEYKP